MTVFNLGVAELRTRQSMKWQTYPADVLPLWVAEMDVKTHPAVKAAVFAELEAGDTGYPAGRRYADAYRAFAARHWGLELADAQVKQSGDVMNSMLGVLQTVTSPGDAVVLNPPVYPPFYTIVERYQRKVVPANLTPDGRLDLAAIAEILAGPAHPRAFLLCSPHNPTGTVHTHQELAELVRLCAANDVALIVDEIHSPITHAGTGFTPILSVPGSERAIAVMSAGKAWNLASFKGGLVIGGTAAGDVLDRLPALLLQSMGHMAAIAHSTAMNEGDAWLAEYLGEVAANKQLLGRLLSEHVPAANYLPGPGTYFAWVDCSALGLDSPATHFRQAGKVAFNDGTAFGKEFGQWIRVNLATSPEIITEAIRRLANSL
ncbi:MAG: aminotransferase class I/II-fold pyridoxal phosphate-dependent enzyme [Propionibacteriaceae bacterium]|nr:aminotransferase class I/II-fold pyridoxal phosphate-dependent enzyme [Propionibacteriaceae bacterium]